MQGFVALPDDLKVAITAIVIWAVAKAVEFAISQIPWLEFLRGYAEAVGYALAGVIVAFVENALPSQYPEISILAVRLLIEILAAVGVGKALSGAKRKVFG